MARLMSTLFVLIGLSQMNALKLLVSEDGDVDEDWEWESDIMFSYKPMAGGLCAIKDGNQATKNGGSANPGAVVAGGLTTQNCDKARVGEKAFKAYCTIDSKTKIDDILKAWKAALVKAKTFKKCPHYYAKLASIHNQELDDGNGATNILSFDVKMDDCAYNMYKVDAVKVKAQAKTYCYTTAGIAWAKNDPKVKNMDGEEFEIMATGTFSLISLQKTDSAKPSFEVLSTIDRAGTRCGATYIQNITLQGQWVEEQGVPQIQVRAQPAVPKQQALEVNFEGSWQQVAHSSSASVKEATAKKIVLQFHQVEVLVSIDSHRIHEEGVKTKRFANFLNVNLQGVSKLSGMSIGGLLGRDSHTAAAEMPRECESTSFLASDDKKLISAITLEP